VGDGVSRKLHLHARRIRLRRPDGGVVDVQAPPLGHMAQSLAFFDFDTASGDAAFECLFEDVQ
jgi:23S rRNA pseudouridine955/2504/2580 synthase